MSTSASLREIIGTIEGRHSKSPSDYVEFPCPSCSGGEARFDYADGRLACLGDRWSDDPPCSSEAVREALLSGKRRAPRAVSSPGSGGGIGESGGGSGSGGAGYSLDDMIEMATRREVAATLARRAAPGIVADLDRKAFAAASSPDGGGDDGGGDADDEVEALLGRFTVLDSDALRVMEAEPDIVEGIVGPPGTISMINGYRGSMKSLTALGLAAAVGSGMRSVYGLRVNHHAPVLYAYLEGAGGLPRRLQAWEAHHARKMRDVSFIHDPLNLKQPGDVRALALLARRLSAGLIVLDSVAKTGGGREDAEDFAAYRAGVEALRDATGAAVLVLHNSGHDKTRGRGHTTLVDGVDSAVILIPRPKVDGGGVVVKDEKSRDSRALEDLHLMFEGAGPADPRTGEPWSGVVVRQTFEDGLRTAMASTQAVTAKVLEAIDAAGGEIAPGALSKVLGIPTDRGELGKVMKTVMAGGEVVTNGKGTRALRYLRAPAD